MGLDRPAKPPDRPDPRPPADTPEPSDDPWHVQSLTRAQAYESLRAQAAELETAEEDSPGPPLTGSADKNSPLSRSQDNRPAEPPGQPADRPDRSRESDDPFGVSTLTRAEAYAALKANAGEQDALSRASHMDQDSGDPLSGRGDPPPPLTSADEPGRHRNYWTEVPRFLRLWADHQAHWPGGPNDRPDRLLELEQPKEMTDSIAQIAEAEVVVSNDVKEVQSRSNPHGWLEGFDFRLKGQDRLREKITSALETSSPDATAAEIAEQIPDAIRYTFCFSERNYTVGYSDIKDQLEEHGYHMYKSKNSWEDSEYKGVNTRWVTAEGQRFEVQFHTPESFHAKHVATHQAYERIRNPETSANERRDLSIFQQEVSSWILVPGQVSKIADYSEEGY